jgi:hypothetical protein
VRGGELFKESLRRVLFSEETKEEKERGRIK